MYLASWVGSYLDDTQMLKFKILGLYKQTNLRLSLTCLKKHLHLFFFLLDTTVALSAFVQQVLLCLNSKVHNIFSWTGS